VNHINILTCFSLGLIAILLTGCATNPTVRGGSGTIGYKITEVTTSPDGVQSRREKDITTNFRQPDSPRDSGTISIRERDGETSISFNTGSSQNVQRDVAAIGALSPLVWAGVGLIILAAVIGVLTKGRHLLASAILGVTGTFLIALSYLLPTFPYTFLIGIILAIGGVGIYIFMTVRNLNAADDAVEETVMVAEQAKKRLSEEDRRELFEDPDSFARTVQDSSTKKLVNKVREKRGLRNAKNANRPRDN
jgi:hypothetical protein